MRNSANKIHTKLTGDVAKASQWVPFARNILDGLIDISGTGSTYTSKTLQPEDGTRIVVRLAGAERFIHIDVTPPCTDRQGFLLTRTNSGEAQTYSANYTDGYTERINPITGLPRPTPDPATRTKGQKVSSDLFSGAFYGKTPAKFSGLMRKVVGCYHLQGLNAPFSYTWGTTHGVIEKTISINNGTPTKKHWIVEVSSLGVYVAPITDTGKCCDSWDVSMYQPTAKELEDNPGWQTYKTTLSLWWAKEQGNRSEVYNVIGSMVEPYNQGTPWTASHGWAFSASGAECRAVTARSSSTPYAHFVCNQWKISFGDDGQGRIVATLEQLDKDTSFVPLLDSPLWVPADSGVWSGVDSYLPLGPEATYFSSQDAPIHVYFDGEDAVVTRWSYGQIVSPAEQTAPVSTTDGPVNYNNLRVGQLTGTSTPQFSCYANSAAWGNGWQLLMGGLGENHPSYTRVTAGFYNSKQSRVFPRYARTKEDYITTVEDSTLWEQEFGNTYGLHEDCYFIRDVPPPTLITTCSSTFHYTDWIAHATLDKLNYTESASAHPALILFGEDREAVLMVWDNKTGQSGTISKNTSQTTKSRQRREYKVDSGDCPLTDVTWTWWVTVPPSFTVTSPAYGDIISSEAYAGGVQLDLGSKSYTYEPTFAAAPFYTWDTYDFQTFLERTAQKTTAVSNVFAIHGNLYYDEAGLNPTNQRDNAVIWLGPPSSFAVGGFDPTGEKISFVGRA